MIPFCDLRPCLTRLFSPRATPNGILLFSFAFPVCRVPFRPSQPERNFIFNTAYPPPARPFSLPEKPPKGIIFPCIPHLPRPFSPLKSPKGNFIFNTAYPPHARLFFLPAQPRTEFYFLTLHPFPSAAARASRAALQYFRSYRPPFTTRSTGFPYMPNTSNDRARNALRSTETEKFSRPQTLRPPQIGVQGRPYKMNTRKNRIHRRGGGYIILGLSAGAGAAGDIIIWKYGTAESARGR